MPAHSQKQEQAICLPSSQAADTTLRKELDQVDYPEWRREEMAEEISWILRPAVI